MPDLGSLAAIYKYNRKGRSKNTRISQAASVGITAFYGIFNQVRY